MNIYNQIRGYYDALLKKYQIISNLFVMSSLLGPYILLSNIFSNTLSLHATLNVSDQVSHPYTTGRNVVLYTLIFIFLDSKL